MLQSTEYVGHPISHQLIVAGPGIAQVIAREWSKDDMRRYLHEHMPHPLR